MVFKNKEELIGFVKHQTNVELMNDQKDYLNRKENLLYTKVTRCQKNSVFGIMKKYGILYEEHLNDNYWVYVN